MSTLTFDTLRYTERLCAAGVSEQQAKVEAEALRDVLSEALDSTLATKADVARLEMSTKESFAAAKLDIAYMDAKVDKLPWMMGILIALSVANFAKQFF